MKVFALLASTLLVPLLMWGQQPNVRYLDENFQIVDQGMAAYYEQGMNISGGYLAKVYNLKDAKLVRETFYKNEKQAIKRVTFLEQKSYNSKGVLISWINRNPAKQIDLIRSEFPNGQMSSMKEIRNGLPLSWKMYYPNGNIKVEASYDLQMPGRPDGPLRWFYPQGNAMASFAYKRNGIPDGARFFSVTGRELGLKEFESYLLREVEASRNTAGTGRPSNENGGRMGGTQFSDAFPVNMIPVRKAIGYASKARANSKEGTIVVRILVDKKGVPQFFYFLHYIHFTLAEPVATHVMDLRFEPASRDGRPISSWINIPFSFRLID